MSVKEKQKLIEFYISSKVLTDDLKQMLIANL